MAADINDGLKLQAVKSVDLRQLICRNQITQVVVVDFDPVSFEPRDLIVDELFGDAAAVGEGGEFAACKAAAVSQ